MIRSQRIKQRMDAEGDAKRVSKLCTVGGAMPAATTAMSEYYRHDGVRITHDPYAPGMAEKYGLPGKTDNEGFDPYADTVGPGIYGGIVKRDTSGQVLIGRQYQNHNPRPGPIYAGGGYTPINEALRKGTAALKPPGLANDISTGGATPLHMCGMGRDNQHATEYLIKTSRHVRLLCRQARCQGGGPGHLRHDAAAPHGFQQPASWRPHAAGGQGRPFQPGPG
ncbi:unnamed protein product, partial [Effrenium voratum]